MKTTFRYSGAVVVAVLLAGSPLRVTAQEASAPQHARPYDQRGVTVFETPKEDTVAYEGFRVFWGAGFAQQFQALRHSNEAASIVVDGVDRNELMEIGAGFNLATANLYLDAQLAEGIRVNLTTYLSSRNHPEAWVKGGYFSVDRLPMFRSEAIDNLMRFVTVRVGHFEINYGDGHFRRSDNGNALYNPFVGNYIMDAFTTEIGGEVYVRSNGFMAMGAVTGGEIRGSVLRPEDRAPSYYGKLGVDQQVTPDLRLRLTGSVYTTSASISNTLYGGDRAGSRYHVVMENTTATDSQPARSGMINPGFRDRVTAVMVNPFVRFGGFELFGLAEQASGRAHNEADDRTWNQYAAEALYRFGSREELFLGGRYNVVTGELAGTGADVTIDRIQLGGGWFLTRNVLMKVEYVRQNYRDFPTTDIRHGGRFDGLMLEGVVAF